MKCFRYTLNERGEGPAGRLPIGSLTGLFANDVYYAAAMIDDFDNITEWGPVEVTPLKFNQTVTPASTPEQPNPTPALVALEPEVRKYYAEKMREVAAPYSPEERDTWFIQVKEAEAWTANSSVATPLLTTISTARSVPLADLVTNIIAKDSAYRTSIGEVLGEQQVLVSQLWMI